MRNLPRVYTSFMPNAPILNGVPGSLLDIIKKCLIGGWTPFDVISIVVANGKATMKYGSSNTSLPDYCRLIISGCDEPQLNRDWTIIRGGDTEAIFETTVADGTYGGSIKAAPEGAGWELMFSGTNEAVIRSGNTDGSGTVVKIIDQNATTAGFNFAFDALSINELIDNARAVDNVERNILKSRNADPSLFRGWWIVCDNSTVYIVTDMFTPGATVLHNRQSLLGGRLSFFGDHISSNKQDNQAFSAYFQPIQVGATGNNLSFGNASPQWSGAWTEDWNAGRPLIRQNQSAYGKWYWCIFHPNIDPMNNLWRLNGGSSNIDIGFVSSVEKAYRRAPVYGRVSGPGSAWVNYGWLPGYRYSDHHTRAIFMPFTSSKDPDGVAYLYAPMDHSNRDNNAYNTSFCMAQFVINRKWDD